MRIGLLYPRATLDTVPSLVGLIEELAARGHAVDLFTYLQAGQPAPRFDAAGIRIRPLGVEGLADHSTAGLRSVVKRVGWLPGAARAPLARTYQAIGSGLASSSRLAARARGALVAEREEPFGCVIGVDPDGLKLAHSYARGAPLVYYSLELLLSYELTTPADQQLKAEERELSRRAAFAVVQDEARAALLADDNGIPLDRVALVPNAPPGPARRQPSGYWHRRFDLPAETRVVVHSGSLGDWTGIQAIVESVDDWPEPWVLVIHTRYDAESSSYVDQLRAAADARRVLFSLKPVARHDYDPLIDGADVGIAFYVPLEGSAFTQRNVQTIGLSSGKLAYYLRAGLPVIVNRAASIASEVELHGMGRAVDSARDIPGALRAIDASYAAHASAAITFFDDRLDFRRYVVDVVQRVEALG